MGWSDDRDGTGVEREASEARDRQKAVTRKNRTKFIGQDTMPTGGDVVDVLVPRLIWDASIRIAKHGGWNILSRPYLKPLIHADNYSITITSSFDDLSLTESQRTHYIRCFLPLRADLGPYL
jgi:hypothetical protein